MTPKLIKIGAQEYKIKGVSRERMGPEASADIDNERNIIRIIRHATRSRQVELILHECIHSMLEGHGFEKEETISLILGVALTQFLADNPLFVIEALKTLVGEKNFVNAVDKSTKVS